MPAPRHIVSTRPGEPPRIVAWSIRDETQLEYALGVYRGSSEKWGRVEAMTGAEFDALTQDESP